MQPIIQLKTWVEISNNHNICKKSAENLLYMPFCVSIQMHGTKKSCGKATRNIIRNYGHVLMKNMRNDNHETRNPGTKIYQFK